MRRESYINKHVQVITSTDSSPERVRRSLERLLVKLEDNPKGKTAVQQFRRRVVRRELGYIGRPRVAKTKAAVNDNSKKKEKA